MNDQQKAPPTGYDESWFPRAAREKAERRKVATIRELSQLPQDVLERALESARTERAAAPNSTTSEGGA